MQSTACSALARLLHRLTSTLDLQIHRHWPDARTLAGQSGQCLRERPSAPVAGARARSLEALLDDGEVEKISPRPPDHLVPGVADRILAEFLAVDGHRRLAPVDAVFPQPVELPDHAAARPEEVDPAEKGAGPVAEDVLEFRGRQVVF